LLLTTPRWMVVASNVAAVVAVLGGLFLAVQVTQRLLTRTPPVRLPSLAQLADSTRHAATPGAGASAAPARSITIGGASPRDTSLAAAQVALARGRWHEAARWLQQAGGDSASGSAALGLSLVRAWQLDDAGAQRALRLAARAQGSLSPDERRWLQAHQRWMTGDIFGADSAYRALLGTVTDDPTLWFAAAFVHRHDGGAIDSALVSFGSPAARRLSGTPPRRLSYGGAAPALWRIMQLSPYHEAARLELARLATQYGDSALLERLAWGAELATVEPETRLAMRVLAAGTRHDSAAWTLVLRLAEASGGEAVLAAARALATASGVLDPRSAWRAAQLAALAADTSRSPRAVAAAALAARGQLLLAVERPVSALEAFHAAAALDSSLGMPLAAWGARFLADGERDLVRRERERLVAWGASVSDAAGRDAWHPHAGMEAHLRAYGIGLLSAALGDTAQVRVQAEALDRLPPVAGDSSFGAAMAGALRGEVALARLDFPGAAAALAVAARRVPPLWRDHSPFTGRAHARFRRAFALQRAWENERARIGYVSFFSPTLAELPLYRPSRERFDVTP
jgi:hypothetical protein